MDRNTELAAAVAALKDFVKALEARPDIDMKVANIGGPASEEALAQVRAVNEELAQLHALADGIHVQWEGKGWDGCGCLRIPEISQDTKFTGGADHYMGFGDEYEALLFDEVTEEGTTWLVREKAAPGNVRLVFAGSGEGKEGVEVAGSMAAYLRRAMENGFCQWWPRCFIESEHVTYEHFEDGIRRFLAEAAPVPIEPKRRVTFTCFSEGGRGTVVELHRVPRPDRDTEFFGDELALVELDVGSRAWIPHRFLSGLARDDGYERLRRAERDLSAPEDLEAQLDAIARAVGPLRHLDENGPSNARRAAGLMRARPFAQAVQQVVTLHERVVAEELNATEERQLEKSTTGFSVTHDFAHTSWTYDIEGLFTGLFGGLRLLVPTASAEMNTAPAGLVDAELARRLAAIGTASGLIDALSGTQVLEPRIWSGGPATEHLAKLGLPTSATLFTGAGY